jgi:hypothetical protein
VFVMQAMRAGDGVVFQAGVGVDVWR